MNKDNLIEKTVSKFFHMYSDNKDIPEKPSQDLSRKLEKVYLEIQPYQVDKDTGEMLNESSEPILVENGTVDIDAEIQSYRDDCDIYKLLERVALTNNMDLLHQNVGEFADIADLPDNIHDFSVQLREVTSPEFKAKLDSASANDTEVADRLSKLEAALDTYIKANPGIKPENTNESEVK